MARLSDNTLVVHPDTGVPTFLYKGDDVPDWAEDQIGEHLLDTGGLPPKSGAGSGKKAWQEYAASLEVEVAEDASRDDVIAALEAAGHPTE